MSDTVGNQMGPFAMVPRWVRRHPKVRGTTGALELYTVLADIADRDTSTATRFRAWLADEMGCSVDTVDRRVKALVSAGALVVKQYRAEDGEHLANEYVVVQVDPSREGGVAANLRLGGGRTVAARSPQICGPIEEPLFQEPKKKKGTRTKKPETPFPPGFELDHQMIEDAKKVGLERWNTEFEKFREYHAAHDSRFADWRAAWRYWCRNAVGFAKKRPARPARRGEYAAPEMDEAEFWAKARAMSEPAGLGAGRTVIETQLALEETT